MESVIDFFNSGFFIVAPFVILLGILIFIHEFGHFFVARLCGVRVEVFSLGFGKKIFKFKRGDTTYAISLIPLGGYVKMFGDDPSKEVTGSDRKVSFLHKPVWQRMAIVLAGPLMNFFFAAFLFFLFAISGEEARKPIIGDVAVGTVAFETGFRSGDQILTVAGQKVSSWDQFQSILNSQIGEMVQFTVQREGLAEPVMVSARPTARPNPNILSLNSFIGDVPGLGYTSSAPVLGVRTDSVAYKLGLRTGFKVNKINAVPIRYFRELENVLIPLQGQVARLEIQPLDPVTRKFGESKVMDIEVPTQFASLAGIGIEKPDLYILAVVPSSPADQAGLKPFDRIIQIDGVEMKVWEDILNTVKGSDGERPLVFQVLREGELLEISMTPRVTKTMTAQGIEERRQMVGISPIVFVELTETFKQEGMGVMKALIRGFERTWEVTMMTVVSILKLIQNQISPKNIGGVISIGQIASETFRIGWYQFFTMMAIISVNLFILNLLPIPVLDGGHLLFYTIEAIKGAPLSMRKMEIAQQIGLFLILSLMVFALYNDFVRLFGF
jgi:regulator of sigma E protease